MSFKTRGTTSKHLDRSLGVKPYCVRGVPFKRERLSFTAWVKKHEVNIKLLIIALGMFTLISFFPSP